MHVTTSSSELDITLDAFGQRLVTIFTQIAFCFQMTDGSRAEDVLSILSRGMERLARQFPWVAGQVVCEGAGDSNTGIFKIKPLNAKPRLSVKDYRDDPLILSLDDLRRSGFPMSALDESIIAPRKSYSGNPGEAIAEVFQLQANFIKGGLILTFLGQHQSMDGIGQAEVIQLFSKACKESDLTDEELRIGNLAPENIIRLLGHSWKPGPELARNIVKHDLRQSGPGSSRTKMPKEKGIWAHFNFSAAALEALKSQATNGLPPDTNFVSTDDTLTAFMLRSITRTRLSRFDPTTEILSARAVDLRRYLDIPQSHPGFVQSMTYHSSTMQQLIDSPLGVIAADFRVAVDPQTSNLAHHGRAFATMISRISDKSTTSYIAGFDMSKDVMLSSWANQNSYELDFGLGLGGPEAVRRPRFDAFQGLVYFMPKALDGNIGVAVCLSAGDMGRLKADGEFLTHATHIG